MESPDLTPDSKKKEDLRRGDEIFISSENNFCAVGNHRVGKSDTEEADMDKFRGN